MNAEIEDAVAELGAARYAEALAAKAEVFRLRRRAETLLRAERLERQRGENAASARRLKDLGHLEERLAADLVVAEVTADRAVAAWHGHGREAPIIEARIRRDRTAAFLADALRK